MNDRYQELWYVATFVVRSDVIFGEFQERLTLLCSLWNLNIVDKFGYYVKYGTNLLKIREDVRMNDNKINNHIPPKTVRMR